jgi:hypothetical protein
MIRLIVLILPIALGLSGTLHAQTDKSEALDKAKERFKKEIARIEGEFLKNIDKIILNPKANKALVDKLTYERPLFVTDHLVPKGDASDIFIKQRLAYLQDRVKATKTLLDVFNPTIEHLKSKNVLKIAEAEALEDTLDELLKESRGYGLAFGRDLEANPGAMFIIENKEVQRVGDKEVLRVIDITDIHGGPELVMMPKAGLQSQYWRFEREEKGFTIKNLKNNGSFNVPWSTKDIGAIMATFKLNESRIETPLNSLFKITSVRREVTIESICNELMLSMKVQMNKGVSTTFVVQDLKDKKIAPSFLWKLIEVK